MIEAPSNLDVLRAPDDGEAGHLAHRLLEGRTQHALLDVDVARLSNVLKIAA